MVEKAVLEHNIPTRILLFVKDIMAYRSRDGEIPKVDNKEREYLCYINVLFYNKGMDMLNLPRILNSRKVMMALPTFLRGSPPYSR